MFTLIVENLRSFEGRHEIEIKPLTLLVGENSSGKSTLLAAISAVTDPSFPTRLPVNDSPYSLGSFSTIATYKGGQYGRAKHFCLGYRIKQDKGNITEYVAKYKDDDGAAVLSEITSTFNNFKICVSVKSNRATRIVVEEFSNNVSTVILKADKLSGENIPFNLRFPFLWTRFFDYFSFDTNKLEPGLTQTLKSIQSITRRRPRKVSRSQSLSPVRMKPKRTYDQIELSYSPEGEHIPYILEKTILDKPRLKGSLISFGESSGLFNVLKVRKLGRSRAHPMQVEIKQAGSRAANLIDVGYGVSQALPVVVESIRENVISRILILQQPEVHLHPKAQAALGTFFCDLVANHHKNFILETHSDYILDRIRLEISKGNINQDDVSLIFAEKTKHNSTLHPITIDEMGNIIEPPAGYRSFFLREQLDLLGR